jgi:hypothetical protein
MIVQRLTGKNIRETWYFDETLGSSSFIISLSTYSKGTKTDKQRVFRQDGIWNCYNHRDDTIKVPPLPDDVIKEAKQYYIDLINKAEIQVK